MLYTEHIASTNDVEEESVSPGEIVLTQLSSLDRSTLGRQPLAQ